MESRLKWQECGVVTFLGRLAGIDIRISFGKEDNDMAGAKRPEARHYRDTQRARLDGRSDAPRSFDSVGTQDARPADRGKTQICCDTPARSIRPVDRYDKMKRTRHRCDQSTAIEEMMIMARRDDDRP